MAKMPTFNITYLHKDEEVTKEVTVIFADIIKADVLRKRFGLPTAEESQMGQMALMAFSALVRAKDIDTNTSAVDFLETIVMIEPIEDAEEDEAEFRAESSD